LFVFAPKNRFQAASSPKWFGRSGSLVKARGAQMAFFPLFYNIKTLRCFGGVEEQYLGRLDESGEL
jgi:hypothetical protein